MSRVSRRPILTQACSVLWRKGLLQGGPAKVKPTYIFAGNIW